MCIVGAGAAGITLGLELACAGRRVVMLEGGGPGPEPAAQEPYQGEHGGYAHRGLHEGRVRAFGGTTNKWGGQILELDPLDFEQRPWIEGSGWPFTKAELAPYYKRALQVEGVERSMEKDDEVWATLGLPVPNLPGVQPYLSRWCPEPNFAVLHGRAIAGSEAIELWLHANVLELLLDGERATGVRARTQSGKEAVFHAERFVFCMGAIESSRFFLQPREGGLPWDRSGLLGKHFQDHIDCNAATLRPRSRPQLDRMFDSILLRGFKYHPKIKALPETQQRDGILNAGATLAYESGSEEVLQALRGTAKHVLRGRLGQVRARDAMRLMRHAPTLLRQTMRYTVRHRSYQPTSAALLLRVHCEQEPCSRSSITLSDQRDALGMFRTKLSWRISELELKTIRDFVRVASLSLAGVAEVVPCAEIDEDEALMGRCEDSFHHMGGMRMDPAATRGVVDMNLKLHGVTNTWICSSAVFPCSGFSNPTHTLLALALRLSDRLCAEHALLANRPKAAATYGT